MIVAFILCVFALYCIFVFTLDPPFMDGSVPGVRWLQAEQSWFQSGLHPGSVDRPEQQVSSATASPAAVSELLIGPIGFV